MNRSLAARALAAAPWRAACVLLLTAALLALDARHARPGPAQRTVLPVQGGRHRRPAGHVQARAGRRQQGAEGGLGQRPVQGREGRGRAPGVDGRLPRPVLAAAGQGGRGAQGRRGAQGQDHPQPHGQDGLRRIGGRRRAVPGGGQHAAVPWKTMPTELVVALADKSLDKHNVSDVALGAFLAMDEKGDRKRARELWERRRPLGHRRGPAAGRARLVRRRGGQAAASAGGEGPQGGRGGSEAEVPLAVRACTHAGRAVGTGPQAPGRRPQGDRRRGRAVRDAPRGPGPGGQGRRPPRGLPRRWSRRPPTTRSTC